MSLNITDKVTCLMDKLVATTISSIMAIIIVTLMIATPVIGSEDYDARKDYTNKECAEMFDPEYDREGYLTCTGGIGIPNPGP